MYGYDANGFYGEPESESDNTLVVKQVAQALFYSATHKIQLWAGSTLIAESVESSSPYPTGEVQTWALWQVGTNRVRLTWLGIDVRSEFEKLGGNVDDLYSY